MFHGKLDRHIGKKLDKGHNEKEVTFRETHEFDFFGDGYVDSRITLQETYEGKTVRAVDQWLEDKDFFSYPYVASIENIETRKAKLIESSTLEEIIVHRNDKEFPTPLNFSEAKIDYNKKGDIEQIKQSNWDYGGMTVDSFVNYEYGKRGLLVEKVTEVDRWISFDEQGDIESRTTEKFTYDRKGKLDTKLTETEAKDNGDLVTQYPIQLELFQHDRRGNVTREELQYDFGDGTVVTVYTKDITCDVRGNITNIVEFDFGRTIRTYFDYDRKGNIIKEDEVSAGDYRYTYEFEYDLRGNLKTEIFKSNKSGGDEIENMLVKNFEHDRKGNILSEKIEYWINDPQEDGAWELTKEKVDTIDYNYVFDNRGKVLTKIKEYDFEGDDIIDRIDTYAFSYGQRGEMVKKVYEEDWGADNVIEYRIVTERLDSNNFIAMDCLLDQLVA